MLHHSTSPHTSEQLVTPKSSPPLLLPTPTLMGQLHAVLRVMTSVRVVISTEKERAAVLA